MSALSDEHRAAIEATLPPGKTMTPEAWAALEEIIVGYRGSENRRTTYPIAEERKRWERLGKAVRSPAKDTLLSHASTQTGRGTAFGVHQAMDQLGAVLGPLLLAAVLAVRSDDYRLAFGVLVVPGVLVLVLLAWLRHRVPDPSAYEVRDAPPADEAHGRVRLPPLLWRYVGAVAVLSCGVASFPLLAYHAQTRGLVSPAQIPLLFALAMLVDGLSGLVMGRVYDRRGAYVLLAVPVAACAAAIAFGANAALVWLGVAIWGVVNGVLDSTVKAVVTELVDRDARPSAFGGNGQRDDRS